MKHWTKLALTGLLALSLCACSDTKTTKTEAPQTSAMEQSTSAPAQTIPATEQATQPTAPAASLDMRAVAAEIDSMQLSDFAPSQTPTDYVKLTVKDFGEIVLRLRPDVAPISAQNFKDLVSRSYFDGTLRSSASHSEESW